MKRFCAPGWLSIWGFAYERTKAKAPVFWGGSRCHRCRTVRFHVTFATCNGRWCQSSPRKKKTSAKQKVVPDLSVALFFCWFWFISHFWMQSSCWDEFLNLFLILLCNASLQSHEETVTDTFKVTAWSSQSEKSKKQLFAESVSWHSEV